MLKATLTAGAGGFLGTCLRYLSDRLGTGFCSSSFPLGTFMANMAGCLLIGLLYGYIDKSGRLSPSARLLWITGLCGGLTTFSSFSSDKLMLLQRGETGMFIFYMAVSLVLGIAMVALGATCLHKAPSHKDATPS